MNWLRLARYLWAAPCSAVGLLLLALVLACGGNAAARNGALETTYRQRAADCGPFTRRLPFRGIVFGHVILAISAEELEFIRAHERVHVAQYERWGPLFFVAYPLSSLWQLLHGRHPYRDNYFEVQARVLSLGAE